MIVGSFVFRNDGDRCLSSKYINTGMPTPLVECCKRISALNTNPFEGIFSTLWMEDTNQPMSGELRIDRVNDFYALTWQVGGTPRFWGQGVICQDLLIGAYWDLEIDPQLIFHPLFPMRGR